MSAVFADVSAFLAPLVQTHAAHKRAARAFDQLAKEEAQLVTTSYVLVETYALIGRRLGHVATKEFRTDFVPLLDVVWIGAEEHERGLDLLLASRSETLSLVDAVSFVVARDRGIERAFAFDRHFTTAGLAAVD